MTFIELKMFAGVLDVTENYIKIQKTINRPEMLKVDHLCSNQPKTDQKGTIQQHGTSAVCY